MYRIAICAPATPILTDDAQRVSALAMEQCPGVELHFHPQCFAVDGHFAGSDDQRLAALLDCANDVSMDAVWFARGGYGAARIAEQAIGQFAKAAHGKSYMGYSDMGYLLGGLYRQQIGRAVHGPMPNDIRRQDGERTVLRAMRWFSGDLSGQQDAGDQKPTVAFNLTTLAMICGTPLMPDLTGHVVMVEEVSEHLYAIDRLFFHITAHLGGIAGLRLGRVSDVPENDRPFGATAEQIARHWCDRHAIAYLGTADIGHDAANKIVPFGLASVK